MTNNESSDSIRKILIKIKTMKTPIIKEFSDLVGKTIISIDGAEHNSDEIKIHCDDGSVYMMSHYQSCCENVSVEDVCGDIGDLLDTPILDAREETSTNQAPPASEYEPESYTWTFYILRTIKGSVTLRWFGSSNGYYSESVNFELINQPIEKE